MLIRRCKRCDLTIDVYKGGKELVKMVVRMGKGDYPDMRYYCDDCWTQIGQEDDSWMDKYEDMAEEAKEQEHKERAKHVGVILRNICNN